MSGGDEERNNMEEVRVTLEGEVDGQKICHSHVLAKGNLKDTALWMEKLIIEFHRDAGRVKSGEVRGQTILEEAEDIINGPRREAYGPVEESFERIARVWSGILGKPVTGKQVALMMIGLKVCREANSSHRDNLVDIVGYTLLTEKL